MIYTYQIKNCIAVIPLQPISRGSLHQLVSNDRVADNHVLCHKPILDRESSGASSRDTRCCDVYMLKSICQQLIGR
jgi:hypothetical protein